MPKVFSVETKSPKEISDKLSYNYISSSNEVARRLSEVWIGIKRGHRVRARSDNAMRGDETDRADTDNWSGGDTSDIHTAIRTNLLEHESINDSPSQRVYAELVDRELAGEMAQEFPGEHCLSKVAFPGNNSCSLNTQAEVCFPEVSCRAGQPIRHERSDQDKDGRLRLSGWSLDQVSVGEPLNMVHDHSLHEMGVDDAKDNKDNIRCPVPLKITTSFETCAHAVRMIKRNRDNKVKMRKKSNSADKSELAASADKLISKVYSSMPDTGTNLFQGPITESKPPALGNVISRLTMDEHRTNVRSARDKSFEGTVEEDLDIRPLSSIPEFNDDRLLSDFIYYDSKQSSSSYVVRDVTHDIQSQTAKCTPMNIVKVEGKCFHCEKPYVSVVRHPILKSGSAVRKDASPGSLQTHSHIGSPLKTCNKAKDAAKFPGISVSMGGINLPQQSVPQSDRLRQSCSSSTCCLGEAVRSKYVQMMKVSKGKYKQAGQICGGEMSKGIRECPRFPGLSGSWNGRRSAVAWQLTSHIPDMSSDKVWYLVNNKTVDAAQTREIFRQTETVETLRKQVEIYRHIVQYSDLLSFIQFGMYKLHSSILKQQFAQCVGFVKTMYLSQTEVLAQFDTTPAHFEEKTKSIAIISENCPSHKVNSSVEKHGDNKCRSPDTACRRCMSLDQNTVDPNCSSDALAVRSRKNLNKQRNKCVKNFEKNQSLSLKRLKHRGKSVSHLCTDIRGYKTRESDDNRGWEKGGKLESYQEAANPTNYRTPNAFDVNVTGDLREKVRRKGQVTDKEQIAQTDMREKSRPPNNRLGMVTKHQDILPLHHIPSYISATSERSAHSISDPRQANRSHSSEKHRASRKRSCSDTRCAAKCDESLKKKRHRHTTNKISDQSRDESWSNSPRPGDKYWKQKRRKYLRGEPRRGSYSRNGDKLTGHQKFNRDQQSCHISDRRARSLCSSGTGTRPSRPFYRSTLSLFNEGSKSSSHHSRGSSPSPSRNKWRHRSGERRNSHSSQSPRNYRKISSPSREENSRSESRHKHHYSDKRSRPRSSDEHPVCSKRSCLETNKKWDLSCTKHKVGERAHTKCGITSGREQGRGNKERDHGGTANTEADIENNEIGPSVSVEENANEARNDSKKMETPNSGTLTIVRPENVEEHLPLVNQSRPHKTHIRTKETVEIPPPQAAGQRSDLDNSVTTGCDMAETSDSLGQPVGGIFTKNERSKGGCSRRVPSKTKFCSKNNPKDCDNKLRDDLCPDRVRKKECQWRRTVPKVTSDHGRDKGCSGKTNTEDGINCCRKEQHTDYADDSPVARTGESKLLFTDHERNVTYHSGLSDNNNVTHNDCAEGEGNQKPKDEDVDDADEAVEAKLDHNCAHSDRALCLLDMEPSCIVNEGHNLPDESEPISTSAELVSAEEIPQQQLSTDDSCLSNSTATSATTYTTPCLIDIDCLYDGFSDRSAQSPASIYLGLWDKILAFCCPGDPRAQLVKKINPDLEQNKSGNRVKDERSHMTRDQEEKGQCKVKSIEQWKPGLDKEMVNHPRGDTLTTNSTEFTSYDRHTHSDSISSSLLQGQCGSEPSIAADTCASMSKTKAVQPMTFSVARCSAKLPPLSDPIIASRLSKQQTMDILDELCQIVPPLSPLPEEDGDHLQVKRRVARPWNPRTNNVAGVLTDSSVSGPPSCSLVTGVKRLGACSVSVPCASAIQYEVCGITVVQLFGTPPKLQLQPAHVSQLPSWLCAEDQMSDSQGKTEVSSLSLTSENPSGVNSSQSSFKSQYESASVAVPGYHISQPSSLEKLCICSLKKNAHCLTPCVSHQPRHEQTMSANDANVTEVSDATELRDPRGTKYQLSSYSDYEIAAFPPHKNCQFENPEKGSESPTFPVVNHNNSYGPGGTITAPDNSHSSKELHPELDSGQPVGELEDFVCDAMSTPIVLSAADRVYHVSADSHKQGTCSFDEELTSHKSVTDVGVKKDYDSRSDRYPEQFPSFSGDILAKAMECAGLTDEVIDNFLRSDFTIESFIVNNEPVSEHSAELTEADEFLEQILNTCGETDPARDSGPGRSWSLTSCQPVPMITLSTQPSQSLPGCSTAPAFHLHTAPSAQAGWECSWGSEYMNYDHSIHGSNLYNWDPSCPPVYWDENMPSTSKMYEQTHQSLNRSVSCYDGPHFQGQFDGLSAHHSQSRVYHEGQNVPFSEDYHTLTLLEPAADFNDTYVPSEHWNRPTLTFDSDIIKQALAMVPLGEDSNSGHPLLKEAVDEQLSTVQPDIYMASMEDPVTRRSQKCLQADQMKTVVAKRNASERERPPPTRSCSPIGRRRRELVQACLAREVTPYVRAPIRNHALTRTTNRQNPSLDKPLVKTRLPAVRFEARSLVCIDRDQVRKRGNKRRVSTDKITSSNYRDMKCQTKSTTASRQQKCLANRRQGRTVSQHIASIDNRERREPQSCLIDSSAGADTPELTFRTESQIEDDRDCESRHKQPCRRSNTLSQYYAERQAEVERFTQQLSQFSPGLFKHNRPGTHWNSCQRLNQISTKISYPLRLSRGITGNGVIAQPIESSGWESNKEMNRNNNADPNVFHKRVGIKADSKTAAPALQRRRQKQLTQLADRKESRGPTKQEHLSPLQKLEEQQQRKLRQDAKMRHVDQSAADIRQTQRKLKNIHQTLAKSYNKIHQAPKTSSLLTVLGQKNRDRKHQKLMFPSELVSNTGTRKGAEFKTGLFPDIASQGDCLISRSQDPQLQDLPTREEASVLKFVQRLDTSYGDQLAKGNPDTKARLNKLCDRYLTLHGNRRARAREFQQQTEPKVVPRKLLEPSDKCSETGKPLAPSGIVNAQVDFPPSVPTVGSLKSNVKPEREVSGTNVPDKKGKTGSETGKDIIHLPAEHPMLNRNGNEDKNPKHRRSPITCIEKAQKQSTETSRTARPLRPDIAKTVNRLSAKPPSPDTKLLHRIQSWETEFGKSLTIPKGSRTLRPLAGNMMSMLIQPDHSAKLRHSRGSKTCKSVRENRKDPACEKSAVHAKGRKQHKHVVPDTSMDEPGPEGTETSVISDESGTQSDTLSETEELDISICLERSCLLNLPSLVSQMADERIDAPELAASAKSLTLKSEDELSLNFQSDCYKNMRMEEVKIEVSRDDQEEGPDKIQEKLSPLNPIIPKESPFYFLNLVDQSPVDLSCDNPVYQAGSLGYKCQFSQRAAPDSADDDTLEEKVQKSCEEGLKRKERVTAAQSDPSPDEDELKYIANIAEPYFSGHSKGWTVQGMSLPHGFIGVGGNNSESDRFKAEDHSQSARKKRDERLKRETLEKQLNSCSPSSSSAIGAGDGNAAYGKRVRIPDAYLAGVNKTLPVQEVCYDVNGDNHRKEDRKANESVDENNAKHKTDSLDSRLEATEPFRGNTQLQVNDSVNRDFNNGYIEQPSEDIRQGVDVITGSREQAMSTFHENRVAKSPAYSCLQSGELTGETNLLMLDSERNPSRNSDRSDMSPCEDPDFQSLESLKRSIDMNTWGEFRYASYFGAHSVKQSEKPDMNCNSIRLDLRNETDRPANGELRPYQFRLSPMLSPILEAGDEEEAMAEKTTGEEEDNREKRKVEE